MPITSLHIEHNHPVFAGHFPARPIVPGVLLLDRTQRTMESETGILLGELSVAKFFSPSTPGEVLELEYETGESSVRFEIRCEARKIANGRFLIAATPIA